MNIPANHMTGAALEALRNALYKFKTYLLTYIKPPSLPSNDDADILRLLNYCYPRCDVFLVGMELFWRLQWTMLFQANILGQNCSYHTRDFTVHKFDKQKFSVFAAIEKVIKRPTYNILTYYFDTVDDNDYFW